MAMGVLMTHSLFSSNTRHLAGIKGWTNLTGLIPSFGKVILELLNSCGPCVWQHPKAAISWEDRRRYLLGVFSIVTNYSVDNLECDTSLQYSLSSSSQHSNRQHGIEHIFVLDEAFSAWAQFRVVWCMTFNLTWTTYIFISIARWLVINRHRGGHLFHIFKSIAKWLVTNRLTPGWSPYCLVLWLLQLQPPVQALP